MHTTAVMQNLKPCHGDQLKDKQEHAETSTAALCLSQCPTDEEGLLRRCSRRSSRHRQARVQVQSGCWRPTHHSIKVQRCVLS